MKAKVIASLFCLLFAIPLGAIGLGALYALGVMVYDGSRAEDWVLVKADVTGPASYRYTLDGRSYDGSRLGTLRLGGSAIVDDLDDRLAGALAENRAAKRPITVFVNPDDPSQSLVDRSIRWPLMILLAPFALAFLGIGIGGLKLVRRIFTEPEADSPGAKARGRKGGSQAAANAASGAGGLWFFALMWNAISFPAAALAIPQGLAEGEWGILFVLLFPLIGIGVLWAAIAATVERLRRGSAGASSRQLNKSRRST